MPRIGQILLASVFGLFVIAAAQAERAIHLPVHGFSIAPLESPDHEDGLILAMSLPPFDGFAPNVSVLKMTHRGTIDGYIAISKKSIEAKGWKVTKIDRLDDNTAVFQYFGQMGANSLGFYSKASLKGDEVLLVTASATQPAWKQYASQLQACVDSFQRDAGK